LNDIKVIGTHVEEQILQGWASRTELLREATVQKGTRKLQAFEALKAEAE
jgi:hypothetical protein